MSTTFGIKVPPIDGFEGAEGSTVIVAFRTDTINWVNPLASLLPDKTKVKALDNSAQGIYTIGDIKRARKSYLNGKKI